MSAMLHVVGQQALAKALVTLLVRQEIIRWFQSRYLPAHHRVRQPPRVLLWDGVPLEDRLPRGDCCACWV